jgi:hypothetical protein
MMYACHSEAQGTLPAADFAVGQDAVFIISHSRCLLGIHAAVNTAAVWPLKLVLPTK